MRVSPASFLMALILDDILQKHNARTYFRHVRHPAAKQMQTQLKFSCRYFAFSYFDLEIS